MLKVWILVAIAFVPFVASIVEELQAATDKTNPYTIYENQFKFAVSLLHSTRKFNPKTSFVISPRSAYRNLLLAYFGAEGKTKEALARGMFLTTGKSDFAKAFNREWSARVQRQLGGFISDSTLDILSVNQNVSLNPLLTDFVADAFDKRDFSDPEAIRKEINSLVEKITDDRIKDFIPNRWFTSDSQLSLANTGKFTGAWKDQFTSEKKETFYSPNPTEVDMIEAYSRFKYGDINNATFVKIPYVEDKKSRQSFFSMYIFLPNNDTTIDDFLDKFSADTFNEVGQPGFSKPLRFRLPKISLDNSYTMKNIYEDMGINNLFGADSDLSDFSNSTHLYFNDIVHRANIEFDSSSTTSSSADATVDAIDDSIDSARFVHSPILTESTDLRPSFGDVDVNYNRPFMFLIHDAITKEMVFTGVYRGPN